MLSLQIQGKQELDESSMPTSQIKFCPYPQPKKPMSEPSISYKEWKVYKNKPPICMLPFPYCLQNQDETLNQKGKNKNANKQNSINFRNLYRLKISNRVQQHDQPKLKNKIYTPYINYQKTPMNQYLNYQLSEQINMGLKEVQIMASQIKRLRKNKHKGIDCQKPVKEKGIRIRKSYIKNWKGLYVNDNQSIRI